jgi:beta-glucosidase
MVNIEKLMEELTLEEKASLLSGHKSWHSVKIPRVGLPSIFITDGPHGLRKIDYSKTGDSLSNSVPAISYPTAATTAASWDPELLREMGVPHSIESNTRERKE